jgi:hypothetical protein
LIIAGIAAVLTYGIVGQHGPIGFLRSIGLTHGDHTASAKVTVDTDDEDASDRAQEKMDRAQEKADRAREKAELALEKAKNTLAAIPAIPPIPPIAAIPPVPPVPGIGAGEARNVAPFDRIELSNNADATITIGDTLSVNVTAPDGENVTTDVHDGKLVVAGRSSGARIVVTMPHLLALEANGAAKIRLTGLKDPIKITAHGPVKLTADGVVDSAELTMDGPSKLSLKELKTKDMKITLNGMGDAEVFATDTLTAEVRGVGHVRYLGDPHTQSTIHGMGSVEKLQS